MGKRKIIWSNKANRELFEIMEFYAQRNKSKTYSVKLYQRFKKELTLLIKQPEIGIKTEIESVQIIVHTLWDCRQNPDDLRIK